MDFEHGVNFCVKEIRAVLGDSARTPSYVETLPRRGYRFVAPVEAAAVPAPTNEARSRRALAARGAAVFVLVSALLLAAAFTWQRVRGSATPHAAAPNAEAC